MIIQKPVYDQCSISDQSHSAVLILTFQNHVNHTRLRTAVDICITAHLLYIVLTDAFPQSEPHFPPTHTHTYRTGRTLEFGVLLKNTLTCGQEELEIKSQTLSPLAYPARATKKIDKLIQI